MINSLKFVMGAVAKKDFAPELCHFHIQGGTVRGYNGMLGLCCPINLNIDVKPNAIQFVKAIQTCKDTVALHVTDKGKLAIKSGNFRAFVECIPGDFPEVVPEGREIQLDGNLLKAIKVLAPFIAEDASRQWARGILFRGRSAFATNNVVIVEYWLNYDFPVDLNIPKAAVQELIRIGEEPSSMQISDTSVTFHFSGNRWLRTQTYDLAWPNVSAILDLPSNPIAPPEGLWQAVEDISPFVNDLGNIFFGDGKVATSCNDGEGASVEVPGIDHMGCFHFKQLALLEKVVEKIDFSTYPKPCGFIGENLRGALAGMRI